MMNNSEEYLKKYLWPLCMICNKLVDKISVEQNRLSNLTIIRAYCHNKVDIRSITSDLWFDILQENIIIIDQPKAFNESNLSRR